MFLRRKAKLNLIDNYISIYRILYNCKMLLCKARQHHNVQAIENLCDKTLDLKTKYENTFKKLRMYNSSFLCLKAELDSCKDISQYFAPTPIDELELSLANLEADINKLNLNLT